MKQQVATQNGTTQASHCIGCHVGTPDGNYVGVRRRLAVGRRVCQHPGERRKGQALPTYPGASCTNWNTCTGSRTYVQYPWMGGHGLLAGALDRRATRSPIVAAQMPASDSDDALEPPTTISWATSSGSTPSPSAVTTNNGQPFPTRGAAFDYMQHTGDLGGVAFPTWSNDGNTIVYSSTPVRLLRARLHAG